MLPEIIRIGVLSVCFVILTGLLAVSLAYLLGNTEDFDEEEWDGPWGKGVIIVSRDSRLPTYRGDITKED